ncbi:hypothetical protein KP509_37G006500 [Ceratopteris richardii]|uniref:HNH domain-containing protein n=1 Tax=Ceratopteris richardii TaxID=49495 RepID=A0A8T2Q669_CERRI|nr:hypothetical protein KP509_37G006500 [Ceratopteris richardii]
MVRGLSRGVRGIVKQSRKHKQGEEDSEPRSPPSGPRSFPPDVKELCWQKAEVVKGRDPTRWRRDPVGNLVFRKLVGCSGCLCYDYDHVIPYSKGGTSTVENCQVLQAAVNRAKGNRTHIAMSELAQKSVYCRLSGRDMDVMEMTAYGDVHHEPGGCNIQ